VVPGGLTLALKPILLTDFIAELKAPKLEELPPEELVDKFIYCLGVLFLPCCISFMVDLTDR